MSVNLRDKWDSTPLYYACLCGHIEVVKYLLANGARCEANTFDGERCLYGALTDQIRNVLRNSKVTTARLDQYDLFLEKLFELGHYYDFVFDIKGSLFKTHKCILAARSEYFKEKFENKWKKKEFIIGSHELLLPEAFEPVLKYIYTGRFSTLKIHFRSCLRLIRLFKLRALLEAFEKLSLLPLDDEQAIPIDGTEQFLMGKFGSHSKLTNIVTIEPDELELVITSSGIKTTQLSCDLGRLAASCVSNELYEFYDEIFESIVKTTSDLCIKVDNFYFNVHKVFLVERCDFFRTFLNNSFNEVKETNVTSEIELKEMTKEVLTEIIYFLYSNNFSSNDLDESLLDDILFVADFYLLSNLKRKCATELANKHLNKENLFDLLRKSRLFDLKKLEFSCITYLADNLFEFEKSKELREIILKDATELKQRQETDTIDIIDDLRFVINEKTANFATKFNSNDLIFEREKKLYLIDQILLELNLEC